MSTPTISGSRLLKLKEWLTVRETTSYLTVLLGEPVTEADVLRLGLDGHLRLSVRFVNFARVWRYREYTPEEGAVLSHYFHQRVAEVKAAKSAGLPAPPSARPQLASDADYTEEYKVYRLPDDDVYDLPMIKGERIFVEQQFQALVGGPEVKLIDIDGPCIESKDGRRWTVLERHEEEYVDPKEPFDSAKNFFPTGEMPEGTTIVVRTAALREFEERLHGDQKPGGRIDRQLGTRERSTLLTIIAALLKHAEIDFKRTSKAAVAVETLTETNGTRIAARTIEDHLKLIPDALERTRDGS